MLYMKIHLIGVMEWNHLLSASPFYNIANKNKLISSAKIFYNSYTDKKNKLISSVEIEGLGRA